MRLVVLVYRRLHQRVCCSCVFFRPHKTLYAFFVCVVPEALLQQIDETDITVIQTKQIELTKETVDALYAAHTESESFEAVSTHMTRSAVNCLHSAE